METLEGVYIAGASTAISFAAAIVVAYHSAGALWQILRYHSSDHARLLIARGVLTALNLMVAATLLNTLLLQSWAGIRMFAFVLLLRTVLKWVFQREQKMIAGRITGNAPALGTGAPSPAGRA